MPLPTQSSSWRASEVPPTHTHRVLHTLLICPHSVYPASLPQSSGRWVVPSALLQSNVLAHSSPAFSTRHYFIKKFLHPLRLFCFKTQGLVWLFPVWPFPCLFLLSFCWARISCSSTYPGAPYVTKADLELLPLLPLPPIILGFHPLIFAFCFESGSHYIVLAILELIL